MTAVSEAETQRKVKKEIEQKKKKAGCDSPSGSVYLLEKRNGSAQFIA